MSIRKKIKSLEQLLEEKEERQKLVDFFNYLWKSVKGEKKCRNCGKRIWGENLSIYHDHLLDKERYPQFKYEEENMFFCCGECHTNKTNGHPGDMHKEAIEKAKQKFLYERNIC